jgi:hypothetical protein
MMIVFLSFFQFLINNMVAFYGGSGGWRNKETMRENKAV